MVTSGSVRTARCAVVFFVMSFIGENRGRELESISQRPRDLSSPTE